MSPLESDRRWSRPTLGALAVALTTTLLVGCHPEGDSYFDPSVVGRWERTPTIVPILDRIDAIETDTGEFVDVTPVRPEDLELRVSEYRISAGDFLEVTIFDFIQAGIPSVFNRGVSETGEISLPQLDPIRVSGLTSREAATQISRAVQRAGVLDDPEVGINPLSRREQTFTAFGAVQSTGRFAIPEPDYRLLDALTDIGGISPIIERVFVIREVPVAELPEPAAPAAPTGGGLPDLGGPSGDAPNLQELINILTTPEEDTPPSPGANAPVGLGAITAANDVGVEVPERRSTSTDDAPPPLIDLPDSEPVSSPAQPPVSVDAELAREIDADQPVSGTATPGQWMFLDGRWVKVVRATAEGRLPEGEDPLADSADVGSAVTQRVIEVPTGPLFQGVPQFNLVIRPGDLIRVPAPESGVVYVLGQGIARPGTYNLPLNGRLTLKRLIAAAGGLAAIAIPERVDITRMVGPNREGTVRINVRAIYEGTQPDLFVRADDLINFGTNFWATPLAVIRGGFRASYGFGFLLDRNFDNDIFGPDGALSEGSIF
ncbi:MAG: polysaccharide biosynthesis/export family protein [Planctomycetota bacterium]